MGLAMGEGMAGPSGRRPEEVIVATKYSVYER